MELCWRDTIVGLDRAHVLVASHSKPKYVRISTWLNFPGFATIKAPPELLWLSASFYFIGGGQHLLLSLYYIMLADMVNEKNR